MSKHLDHSRFDRVRDALKYVNSLPFPLTVRQYYAFDDSTSQLKDEALDSAESWDVLREEHPHFSISDDREEWLKASEAITQKDGQDGALIRRAKDVVNLVVEQLGITSIFSVGVGGAGLEYQIKKLKPGLELTCSEYSTVAVETLKKVFIECDSIVRFDMKSEDWSTALREGDAKKQLCLMCRVDPHFTDEEWSKIFRHAFAAGIENILFIPCSCLTARAFWNRLFQRHTWKKQDAKYVFSGYLRTKRRFQSCWRPVYAHTELDCGGSKSFLLKKR